MHTILHSFGVDSLKSCHLLYSTLSENILTHQNRTENELESTNLDGKGVSILNQDKYVNLLN